MKLIIWKIILYAVLCCCHVMGFAQDSIASMSSGDTMIQNFVGRNPRTMKIECLQEETLLLAADESHVLMVLDVANPQLLLRLFMKGFSIYVDSTGKKRERFEVLFPGAESLDMTALGIEPHQQDPLAGDMPEKPNILPLIEPLNKKGATYQVSGKPTADGYAQSFIMLDTEEDHLYYYALLPLEELINVKKLSSQWSIGVYSQEIEMNPEQSGGMMPPPQAEGEPMGPEQFTKEISEWYSFSFDELSSMNLE